MKVDATKEKIFAAYDLLQGDTTTWRKFDSIKILIQGRSKKIDSTLTSISKLRSEVSKMQNGDVIKLSAEKVPGKTDEDKKRKKTFLKFIRLFRQLKSEIATFKEQFEQTGQENISDNSFTGSKIISNVRKPLGIITIGSTILVAGLFLINSQSLTSNTIKVIDVNGKKIPLTELKITEGEDCLTDNRAAAHYHLLNNQGATALDDSIVPDPNPSECGFGKVEEVVVEEI